MRMETKRLKHPPGRLLAFGDIHGCRDQLNTLLTKVGPTQADQVIFLGDYIDRGPDSSGVITDLLDFLEKHPDTIFLRGNHEQMFIDYLDGQDPLMFLVNGGTKTLLSYERKMLWPLPATHRDFLNSLRLIYETEDFIFVHAGLRPGVPVNEQDPQDIIWIRHEFINSDYDWGKTVVYGHTPLQEPLLGTMRLGLDTGCVYGRQLTCCDVLTRQIWQA